MTKDNKIMRIKEQKKINDKSLKIINDDSGVNQSFLNLPPENLSISHSDIEQGFNKYKKSFKYDKSTILSLIALFIGLICITIESIKLQKVYENSRDIDNIKKDIEILKNYYYEEDLLDELRAFEEQLNADEEGGTINSNIDNDDDDDDDYDQNYDDDDDDYNSNESNDYSNEKNNTKIKNNKLIIQSNKKQDNIKHNKKKRFVTNEYISNKSMLIDDKKSLINNENKTIPNNDNNKLIKYHKSHKNKKSNIVKRNLRSSKNMYAANYEADMMMFHHDDEHTGNGRAKHNEGIFKAWKSSEWMDNLGMNRYFTLSRDGKLTVHESGVYLVYAQIHYLDEHDENGFHMLIDGIPILQCMVYSPGIGHKSRSCYSSQVTYIKSGNHIVIKDVGPARYTLFQRDKSFFGLTKLGDVRQQQQQQSPQLTWHSSPSSSSSSTPHNSKR